MIKKTIFCIASKEFNWVKLLESKNIYSIYYCNGFDEEKIQHSLECPVNEKALQNRDKYEECITLKKDLNNINLNSIGSLDLIETSVLIRSCIVIYDTRMNIGFDKLIYATNLDIPIITISTDVTNYYPVGIYSTAVITNPTENNIIKVVKGIVNG